MEEIDKSKINYFCLNGEFRNIGTNISNKMQDCDISNQLEYLNTLIEQLLALYKDQNYALDELIGYTKIAQQLNLLMDLKIKIVSCSDIKITMDKEKVAKTILEHIHNKEEKN